MSSALKSRRNFIGNDILQSLRGFPATETYFRKATGDTKPQSSFNDTWYLLLPSLKRSDEKVEMKKWGKLLKNETIFQRLCFFHLCFIFIFIYCTAMGNFCVYVRHLRWASLNKIVKHTIRDALKGASDESLFRVASWLKFSSEFINSLAIWGPHWIIFLLFRL